MKRNPKAERMVSDLSRGHARINKAYSLDAELMDAYSIYQLCVGRQMASFETKDHKSTRSYPTGFTQLPYAGSIMDQPHRLMEYFSIFLSAERNQFFSKH